MFKRVTAWILFIALLFTYSQGITAQAKSDYNAKKVALMVYNDETDSYSKKHISVLEYKDSVYMSTDDISTYTIYWYNSDDQTFYFDNHSADSNEIKKVYINAKKNKFEFLNTSVKTQKVIDYNGKRYLCVADILPCLNAAPLVIDGALCICSDSYSLWQIFNTSEMPSGYYYDIEKEYYNRALAATLTVPNYFIDSLRHWRIDRTNYLAGTFFDYSSILSNYILYDETIATKLAEKMDSISGTSDTVFTANDFIGYAIEFAGVLEEIDLDNGYHVFGGNLGLTLSYAKDAKAAVDNLPLDKISLAIDAVTLAAGITASCYRFENSNEDYINSLGVVKEHSDLMSLPSFEVVQALYSNDSGKAVIAITDNMPNITDTVFDVASAAVSPASPAGITLITLNAIYTMYDLTGATEMAEEVCLLLKYEDLMNVGLDAINSYSSKLDYSKSDNENLRLSLLFYLNMSRNCYTAQKLAYEYSKNFYFSEDSISNAERNIEQASNRIDEINDVLAKLLLAGDSAPLDSVEGIKDTIKKAKKEMKKLTLSDVKADWVWLVEPTIAADDLYIPRKFGDINNKQSDSNYSKYADLSQDGMDYCDRLVLVEKDNKFGMCSYSGYIITDIEFSEIYYSNYKNKYILKKSNGNIYTLDSKNVLSEKLRSSESEDIYMYEDIYAFYIWAEGMNSMYVSVDDIFSDVPSGFNGTTGVVLVDADEIYWYSDNSAYFSLSGPNYEYVVVNGGKRVTTDVYENVGYYSDGVIPVKLNGKWGYIDGKGNTVLPFEFDDNNVESSYSASNGYIAVCKGGQYALYDVSGNIVIDYGVFDQIRPVYEGMFWAQKDGLWGVVGLSADVKNTNTVLPEKYCDEISTTVNSKSGLRMREGPGTDYNVIGMLSNKKKVTLCGTDGSWAYIRADYAYGWVSTKYLKVMLNETDSYNEEILIDNIIDKGYALEHESFRYDSKSAFSTVFYPLWQRAVFDDSDYYSGNASGLKANVVDEYLYNNYHIVISHDSSSDSYKKVSEYKNGYYYPEPLGSGYECTCTASNITVYKINDNVVFVTFTLTQKWIDGEKTQSKDSAVLYVDDSNYALIEYQSGSQTLSTERLLHYLFEFE